jgi:CheY-like chemotaxis protein
MEELKSNWQTKHIPVHMMSSHKMKQESLLKGAVNFLDKPVAFEQMPDIFKRIEQIVNKESQKVLIIEDNPKHAKALAYFLETYNINSEIKSDVTEGVDALHKQNINCVILDMGIPDQHAYEILDDVKKNQGLENLPVIVFTGKSLSMKEELKIKKYADSIVVKTAHSYQRMLDEVSLFLHLVEENKKGDGKKDAYKKLSLLNNVLNGKTVLVVDDDVRNIYSLTKALEVLKMEVITAIDGKEALKALEEHPEIDVVLLDMMMPNMDGYETASRIRENSKYKTLPVIAVTAKAMTGDREKCINAGASDYITKPVDVDQLLSLLRVWLYDQQ